MSAPSSTPAVEDGGLRMRTSSAGGEETCWICLEEGCTARPLESQCNCPNRKAHDACDARWRLHQAGRMEEMTCRFCAAETPGWKQALSTRKLALPSVRIGKTGLAESEEATSSGGDSSTAAAVPTAYMKISWGGKTHQIQVLDGAEGREKFINDCRRLLEIPENVKFDIVYHCKEPFEGGDLTLRGMGAYDAAFYCAAASNASTTVGRSSTRKVSNPESAPSPPSSTTPTSTPTAAQAPTPAQAEGDGVLAHSSRRVRQAAAPSNMGMKKKLMNSLKAAVCLGM